MRLIFTALAEHDLEAIGDYIAKDNPLRALSFLKELRQHCTRILDNPMGYRMRPEFGETIRSCAHGRYVVFYSATPSEVVILRVIHGARDLGHEFAP
jgi:toxin ParE1/3/4